MKITDEQVEVEVKRWTRGTITMEQLMFATCDCGYLLPRASDPHGPECGYSRAKEMVREQWERMGMRIPGPGR